jgi:hypothetical protein
MDDGHILEFLPSGRRYRVVGSVGQKEHPEFDATHGIEVDVLHQDDGEDSVYLIRVSYVGDEAYDGDVKPWEKYYMIGDKGLVKVDDPHGA